MVFKNRYTVHALERALPTHVACQAEISCWVCAQVSSLEVIRGSKRHGTSPEKRSPCHVTKPRPRPASCHNDSVSVGLSSCTRRAHIVLRGDCQLSPVVSSRFVGGGCPAVVVRCLRRLSRSDSSVRARFERRVCMCVCV